MTKNKTYTICPDENILAQFIEGTLSEQEEDLVLAHFDQCPTCYNVVRAILESEVEESLSASSVPIPIGNIPEVPKYHAAGKSNGEPMESTSKEKSCNSEKTTCAIKVQQLVLKSFGIQTSEEQLLEEALQKGWFVADKGMLLEHVGKSLTSHGIKTKRSLNTCTEDIAKAVKEGSKVIVAVDSGELWYDSAEEHEREEQEDLVEEIPDHVVLVEDLVTENNTVVGVSIKDPLLFEGVKTVPLDVFMDAWQDSDFFMIKTIS